jgi:HD-like signal output (HDOD) protein
MIRILFVDDEINILHGLRRALRSAAGKWDVRFAASASEATAALATQPFDVIVSDLEMPGTDGVQLLAAVQKRWPSLLRVLTTGSGDWRHTVVATSVAHQFLAKPYTTAVLEEVVDRTMRMRQMLHEPALVGLVERLDHLPSLPGNYARLTTALRDPARSMQEIGTLVEADVGLTARVLQLVNSAVFALPRRVTSPGEAALFLGIDVLQSLVLATEVFGVFEHGEAAALVQRLWAHSVDVAARARTLGRTLGCSRKAVDEAFLAGLMHEIGGLILFQQRPCDYLACREEIVCGADANEVEQRCFGTTAARLAAYVLANWGLPEEVVVAIAFHAAPAQQPQRQLDALALVHFAHASVSPPRCPGFDRDYLAAVGLLERTAGLLRVLAAPR